MNFFDILDQKKFVNDFLYFLKNYQKSWTKFFGPKYQKISKLYFFVRMFWGTPKKVLGHYRPLESRIWPRIIKQRFHRFRAYAVNSESFYLTRLQKFIKKLKKVLKCKVHLKLHKNVVRMSLRRLDQILWHQVSSSSRAKIVKNGTKFRFFAFQWWIQTIIKTEPDVARTFQRCFWKA